MTYEDILNRMLNLVPPDLDKREGSVIFNALAPASAELAQMYIEIEDVINRTFADTATGEDLTRRVAERGVNRYTSTYAIRKGVFNLDVPIGSRFTIEDVTYIVTDNLVNHESKLQCEQTGTIGNNYIGTLLPITNIKDLTTATLTDILIPGEDEESDAELRLRYYDNLESQSFGGNQADYKTKTKALDGVYGCKVFPVWNGGGTVKLVIMDSTYSTPSGELITSVQTAVDPTVNQGLGLGYAPIGHTVTVAGVEELTVNIAFSVTCVTGYVWADISTYVSAAIEEYLLSLRSSWDSESALIVRISQLESVILQVTGVLDISGTTLNSVASNLTLSSVQIPILGTVTNV